MGRQREKYFKKNYPNPVLLPKQHRWSACKMLTCKSFISAKATLFKKKKKTVRRKTTASLGFYFSIFTCTEVDGL